MEPVVHIGEQDTLDTARALIKALGDQHPLAQKWIKAARQFGLIYRPDIAPLFSKPV